MEGFCTSFRGSKVCRCSLKQIQNRSEPPFIGNFPKILVQNNEILPGLKQTQSERHSFTGTTLSLYSFPMTSHQRAYPSVGDNEDLLSTPT